MMTLACARRLIQRLLLVFATREHLKTCLLIHKQTVTQKSSLRVFTHYHITGLLPCTYVIITTYPSSCTETFCFTSIEMIDTCRLTIQCTIIDTQFYFVFSHTLIFCTQDSSHIVIMPV